MISTGSWNRREVSSNSDTIVSSRSKSCRSAMVGGVVGLRDCHSGTIAEPQPVESCLATVLSWRSISLRRGRPLISSERLLAHMSLAMAKLAFSSAWSRSSRTDTSTKFCSEPVSQRKKVFSEARVDGEFANWSPWLITALMMLPIDCSVALTVLSRFDVDVRSKRESFATIARSDVRACTATARA